jgi:hypothetical protein
MALRLVQYSFQLNRSWKIWKKATLQALYSLDFDNLVLFLDK